MYLCSALVALLVMGVTDVDGTFSSRKRLTKVITMNPALADIGSGILGTQEREDALIKELIARDAHVICLQEVIRGTNVQTIVQALAAAGYRYSMSGLHDTTTWELPDQGAVPAPPCPPTVVPLLASIQTVCAVGPGTSVFSIFGCLYDNFRDELLALGQKCRVCLGTEGALARAVPLCITRKVDINVPGLVMISKRRMTDQDVVDFHNVTTIIPRFYLTARIKGLGKTFCTHMTSTPDPKEPFLTVEEGATSDEQRNLFQANVLLRAVRRCRYATLLGDFNTTPRSLLPPFTQQFPESYDRLRRRLRTRLAPNCTFCLDNKWAMVGGHTSNNIIDHVFTKGLRILRTRRVLDDQTAVFIPALNETFPIADHYGVEACIKRPSYRYRSRFFNPGK